MRLRPAAVVAFALLGLAVAHGLYLVFFAFQGCSVEASEQGEPPNGERCRVTFHPVALAIVLLLAAIGLAFWRDHPAGAWGLAVLATVITTFFGLSLGLLIYHCFAALVAVAVWHAMGRPRPSPAPAPAPPSP